MMIKTCPICKKTREVKTTFGDEISICRSCAKKQQYKDGSTKREERNCKFCGEPFIPNSNRQIYCKRIHYRNCPICNKLYIEDNVENLKRPPVACSYECRSAATRITSLHRYGCLAPGNNPEARLKAEATMMKHLGVKYAMQNEEVRNRSRISLIERYGFDNAQKNKDIRAKTLQTKLDKYGSYLGPVPKQRSKINIDFENMLMSNCIHTENEYRIDNRIFDIKLTDSNTLIEINPTYTHNSIGNHYGDGLDKYYHRDKTLLAENNGYRCIHVWDWDNWGDIINLIRPIERRIYARDCAIYIINKPYGDAFLAANHLQGTCRGQKLYLGLVYEDELVELMTFGNSRFDKNYYTELMRLCTVPGVQVIGGASKLFHFATHEYGLYKIISYCDRSKFTGSVYEKMGMKFKRITPPQEIWSKSTQHITANLLRARGYDQLFKTNYGKGISNEELMLQNGWLPVYDCGQRVYVFE